MLMRAVYVGIVCCVLAACGGDPPVPMDEYVIGTWRVDPVSSLTAFSQASRQHLNQIDARRRQDPAEGKPLTPEAHKVQRDDARDWALAFAYGFRLVFLGDGRATITLPTMGKEPGDIGTRTIEHRWTADDDAVRFADLAYGQPGLHARVERANGRLLLVTWQVVVPASASRGKFGNRLELTMPLVRAR